MSDADTVTVPHLGGSVVGYRFGRRDDPSLPTLVMVNSCSTSAELSRPQFAHTERWGTANLLALELYAARVLPWAYWDTAVANLHVLDALGIPEAS